MRKLICVLCLSILFVSGCYDAREPNEIAYITAVGIDLTEDEGIYEYTIQFAKTTQISGGSSEEGGKEESNIVQVINVKAPTIYSGINIANQIVSKSFTLAHTKLMVISEELAKKGVRDLVDTFGRNSDIRPNIYMSVSRGKAKEYLESVKPMAEVNPVNYYRLIYESEHGGYVPKVVLKDFYFQIDGTDKQGVLPLAGVNEENKKKEQEEDENSSKENQQNKNEGQENQQGQEKQDKAEVNKQGFDYLTKSYLAGNIDVEKKNASEVMGMAVFKNDTMIGTMDSLESVIYNMLSGTLKLSYISFYNEDYPDVPLTIALEQFRNPSIAVKINGEVPEIKIKAFLEGQLISESMDEPIEDKVVKIEEEIEKETENAIKKFLMKTTEEYDSDIVGFGQYAKKNFLTYDEFNEYDWDGHYQNSEFNAEVEFELRRIGFVDLGKEEK